MPLSKCPACGHAVSNEALSCPGCGHPLSALDDRIATESPRRSSALGYAGAALLVIGVFCPIVGGPFGMTLSLIGNGHGDGVIVLVLAALIALALALRWYVASIILAVLAAVITAYDYVQVRERLSNLGNSMFAGTTQMQWGWAVLAIGALLCVVGAFKSGYVAHRA